MRTHAQMALCLDHFHWSKLHDELVLMLKSLEFSLAYACACACGYVYVLVKTSTKCQIVRRGPSPGPSPSFASYTSYTYRIRFFLLKAEELEARFRNFLHPLFLVPPFSW